MERVSGGRYASAEAVLEGYARSLLHGKTYPGIVAAEGERTSGVVYLDLEAAAWACLDRFEDELYERARLTVAVEGRGELVAFGYVVPPARRHLLGSEPWDLETFRRRHLAAFMASRNV
jgi:gamma-glutamylcyclotransferase (GGCT)/AIG2-like uncharacterized protein YtfP